ncbi:MAG: hypothetical protein R3C69_03380 [Geminicoccaceae bacterium]
MSLNPSKPSAWAKRRAEGGTSACSATVATVSRAIMSGWASTKVAMSEPRAEAAMPGSNELLQIAEAFGHHGRRLLHRWCAVPDRASLELLFGGLNLLLECVFHNCKQMETMF